MNWKTVFVIIGLLLIGFVGGYTTHRIMLGKRLKEVKKRGPERHLRMKFKDILQADEAQWAEIEPFIDDYSQKLGELGRDFHKNRKQVYDSLITNITPLLQPEQVQRLEDFAREMREKKWKRDKKGKPKMGERPGKREQKPDEEGKTPDLQN